MMKLLYRLYYDDDTTYDNRQGSPWEAPRFGCQVVAQLDPEDGTKHVRGDDYFVYRDDLELWLPSTLHGLEDHCLFFARHVVAVVKGRRLTDARFNEIKRRAVLDPDLPTPSEFTR